MAFASKLSVGHQEIDRIIDEVEQTYRAQPTEWLPIAPVGNMVALQWYEDVDEFEDAIGGEFIELLRAMPHIEVRDATDGETPPGFFKVREPDPDAAPRLPPVSPSHALLWSHGVGFPMGWLCMLSSMLRPWAQRSGAASWSSFCS